MKSITVFIIALLFTVACKKNDNNNPAINDRTINKNITAIKVGSNFMVSDYLDLDDDGKLDINFEGILSDSTKYLRITGVNDSTNILSDFVSFPSFLGGIITIPKTLTTNTLVDVSSSHWVELTYIAFISTKVTKEFNDGIHGDGDVYLAFQIEKNTGNNYYGWMLINVSSDMKAITVKEVAVNTVANKGINIGEK
ncbi:MAG: hypothetical protein U0U67_10240 [Chitinophagales bacterium]